ncbi:Nitrogenase (molybdenum-iron) beta chain [Dissulfuribacter thermophilus]|uniref:Nitrogenase molybdenum-iron protein beta chain n=1 Tax=Dissulfuribacter thermophilus TaxID=1156395 RepID=A0A1B9F4E1_9BACT|nr:nitrogenase molybdenum-iron protein subunit beta [Dissulfuribacter thermophilus]OCC14796.1 Nitrogenase (molybdenum-iron) beta chain [Dissulfuribacter thermophilus]
MLNMTPKEIFERKALRINPAKTCQPIGALYASLGIHNCLPHSHGSQGCCAYHRSHLTRHYKEPIMASTSSFTEGSSVFGGGANLRQALKTIFQVYDPEIVAVHTTCLSETIGDDLPSLIKKAREDGIIPEGKFVIHTNTPSYVGSHVTGFSNMTAAMVKYFAKKNGASKDTINVVPGYVEPSDMREIKRLVGQMGIKYILFPDTSDVLDSPQRARFSMYPKGGVKIEDLKDTGSSKITLSLGKFASEGAATLLDQMCEVPYKVLDLPIGIAATDRFIEALIEVTGKEPPESITDERGRVVDIMTDMLQYFHGKKVAVFGDPDQVISMTEFLVHLGMKPVHIVTGTPGKYFERRIKEIVKGVVDNPNVKAFGDLFLLHQWIKNEPVDLLIGNTYGKYIARAEDIPFVRFGFPILDRIGHSYFPTVGYRGAMRLLEKMLDALLDRQDRDAPDSKFELVM